MTHPGHRRAGLPQSDFAKRLGCSASATGDVILRILPDGARLDQESDEPNNETIIHVNVQPPPPPSPTEEGAPGSTLCDRTRKYPRTHVRDGGFDLNDRATLSAFLAIVMMAGCVSGGSSSGTSGSPTLVAPAGPAEVSDDTGAVEGVVTDDELNPITQAQVGILEETTTTFTDTAGRFTLSNLKPGTLTLVAQKLGYDAAPKKVDVVAGQITKDIRLILTALPVEGPYPELIIHSVIIENGVGLVRTATCTNCGGPETFTELGKKKSLAMDYSGVMIESVWQQDDYLGIDFVDRDGTGNMYWRIRSQSPIHFLLERCADYVGAPHYGRQKMPCTDEELEGNQIQVENWYIGDYQEYTHLADPVCQTPVTNPTNGQTILPGYQAGCYGLGYTPEMKVTDYITIFHGELPADVASYSAIPD